MSLVIMILIAIGGFSFAAFQIQKIEAANLAIAQKEVARHDYLKLAAEKIGLSCLTDTASRPTVEPLVEEFRIYIFSKLRAPIEFKNLITAEVDSTRIMVFDMSSPIIHHLRIGVHSCRLINSKQQTVGLIQSSDLDLPLFDLEPLNFRSLSGNQFEQFDVKFLNDPSFKNFYRLRGNDCNGVRDLFDSQLRKHLMELDGIYVEGKGDLLLYCFPDTMMEPSELQTFFSVGFNLMSLLARQDVQRECVANDIRELLSKARQA